MKSSLRIRLIVLVAVLASVGVTNAQERFADPPGRVARLQFIGGQVSLQPGGVDEWIDAGLNRPLTTADRIWTDIDARAELTIGSAAFRLGSETSMTLTNLSDDTAQIELDQGTLNLSVRYLHDGEVVEVDTPNVAFTVMQPGDYRFDVMPDADQTAIQVRRGDGQANGSDDWVDVPSGRRFVFGHGQSLEYRVSALTRGDQFDRWSDGREREEISSPSAQYVAPGTVGYEALDGNGYWQPSPMYGAVWYPNVHPGWAPYHEGHWAWVEPWGWTWVDDAPWGFAPFHYGRWVNDRGRWGWVPGPREARPVYAPALVAWVGGGPGIGASIGIAGGGVGWVALGWHDPYLPSYHVSPEYARNVNVSNSRVVNTTIINNYYTTTNINERNSRINNIQYENARVNGAMTAVPRAAFSSGKPVAQAAVVIPAGAATRTNFGAAANVAPTKEAVMGGHVPSTAPARLTAPRQVVAKTPPPPPPVSFEQQRPLLEKSNGVPLNSAARANLRTANPAAVVPAGRPTVIPAAGAPGRPTGAPAPSGRPFTPTQPAAPAIAPHPAPPAAAPAMTPRPAPPAAAPAVAPHPAPPAAAPAMAPHPAPSAAAPAVAPHPAPPAAAPAVAPHPAPPAAAPAVAPRPAPPAAAPAVAPHPAPPAAAPAMAPHPAPPAAAPAVAPHPAPPAAAPAAAPHPAPPAAAPGREAAPGQQKKGPAEQKDNREKKNEQKVN